MQLSANLFAMFSKICGVTVALKKEFQILRPQKHAKQSKKDKL
jgi:hypothetical protein